MLAEAPCFVWCELWHKGVLFFLKKPIKAYFMLECYLITAFRWKIIFALRWQLYKQLFSSEPAIQVYFWKWIILKLASGPAVLVEDASFISWKEEYREPKHKSSECSETNNLWRYSCTNVRLIFCSQKYVKHDIHIFHLKPNPAGYHSGGVVGQGFSYTGNFPWFQNFVPSS